VRDRMLARVTGGAILVAAIVLGFASGWEAKFPALWPPLLVLGMGVALSMRSSPRTFGGVLARACAVLGAFALAMAIAFRWLR
jgi:hypothetical protein